MGINTESEASVAEEQSPKLHIDSDWKDEVERERAKLAEKEQETGGAEAQPGPNDIPPR